jgi:hypothetical protein
VSSNPNPLADTLSVKIDDVLEPTALTLNGVRYRLVREDAPVPVVEPLEPNCYLVERHGGQVELWLRCDDRRAGSLSWTPVTRGEAWLTWNLLSPRRIQRVLPGDVRWKDADA